MRALLVTLTMLSACGTRGGPDWLTGDCRADHEETIRRLDAVAKSHRSPCTTASDCVVVEAKVSCQLGSLVAIASAERAAWETDQQAFQASVCPFLSTACSVVGDGPSVSAVCVDGACGTTFAPTDGGP